MVITPLHPWIHNKIKNNTLDEYRIKSIRDTLDYVKENSPFYKNHLSGIDSKRIGSLDDLLKIPTTSAKDIKSNPAGFVCVPQNEISRIITIETSGTTGKPKRIYFTEEDLELTVDFFMHGMMTLVGKGDRVLIMLPGEKYGSVGYLLRESLRRMGVFSELHGVLIDLDKCLEDIKKYNINCVVGIPVQVLDLSYETNKVGIQSIDKVLLSADYIPDSVVLNIENNFNCTVYSHYGMTEMGFGGGVECSAFDGYHTRDTDLYFEVIDPKSGWPLPDGQWGEVVFTTLNRKGMPLIRYRTGDVSRFINRKCGCGSDLRRLDKIRGRIADFIVISPGISIGLPDLDEEIFKVRGIVNYSVNVFKEDGVFCLKILLKITPEFSDVNQVMFNIMENYNVKKSLNQGLLKILPIDFVDYMECSTGMVKRKIEIFEEDRLC